MTSSQIVALAAFALLLAAGWCDLRSRTIPDLVPIALCLLGLMATWRRWHDVTFAQLGIGFGIGLTIGAALFYAGAFGGGDAKLGAGLGAVCGWPQLLEVLFATALCGGLLSLWAKRRRLESLPYAPAFAGGYATTVAVAWLLAPTTGLWHLVTGGAL